MESETMDEDQPTTCPKCGARTDFEDCEIGKRLSIIQRHICLNKECKHNFIVEEDEEGREGYGKNDQEV